MRFHQTIPCFALVMLLVAAGTSLQAGEPGTAGFLSLRLGSGARAAAMGDAQVALAKDATAVYWNPAGLAAIQGTSFALQHNKWFDTIRLTSAAFGHATDFGVFGLNFAGMYMDAIPKVETASNADLGNFNVYEVAISAAWALFESF